MKKVYLLSLLVFMLASQLLQAQSVLFKPGPGIGVDATIQMNTYCPAWDNQNYGNDWQLSGIAWTWYALNCGPGVIRGLVRFDQLNTLPAGAIVTYAELRLYGPDNNGWNGNSQYPGSPFPDPNNCWIRRVTSPWTEMGVTWNTQPAITTTDQVAVPVSTSQWHYNVSLDVTNQVIAMLAPGQNHGFMLMLDNETYYRGVNFASSDDQTAAYWPELYIEYTMPCQARFRYCASSGVPGTYRFNVENPQPGYTYTWSFGDGYTANGTFTTHAYQQAGNYEVCLEAVNDRTGEKCRECISICVKEPAPCDVSFTYEVSDDLVTYFHAQTNGWDVSSYWWDFGDGNGSSKGPDEYYGYKEPGVYQVCLTVVYKNGCEARYCYYITVGENRRQQAAKTTGQIAVPDKMPVAKAPATGPAGSMKVSPNPTGSATVTAIIDAAAAGTYKYVVYDAQGKPALTGSKGLVQGVQNIQLSVKELQPGKYWIEFSNNRQQLRTSFVKL